jgi:hypothetical protein
MRVSPSLGVHPRENVSRSYQINEHCTSFLQGLARATVGTHRFDSFSGFASTVNSRVLEVAEVQVKWDLTVRMNRAAISSIIAVKCMLSCLIFAIAANQWMIQMLSSPVQEQRSRQVARHPTKNNLGFSPLLANTKSTFPVTFKTRLRVSTAHYPPLCTAQTS